MVEIRLGSSPPLQRPLAAGARPASEALMLSLRSHLALATVMVRKDRQIELDRAAKQHFGMAFPGAGIRAQSGAIAFAWSAPGQWLAIAEHVEPSTFEADLKKIFGSLASVSNQSDGRTIFRLSGPRTLDVLAKGVPLDLHPTVFGPGRTAVTAVAHIGVHLWQIDTKSTFEFAVFRSFADAFWHFLEESAVEFGYSVDEEEGGKSILR